MAIREEHEAEVTDKDRPVWIEQELSGAVSSEYEIPGSEEPDSGNIKEIQSEKSSSGSSQKVADDFIVNSGDEEESGMEEMNEEELSDEESSEAYAVDIKEGLDD